MTKANAILEAGGVTGTAQTIVEAIGMVSGEDTSGMTIEQAIGLLPIGGGGSIGGPLQDIRAAYTDGEDWYEKSGQYYVYAEPVGDTLPSGDEIFITPASDVQAPIGTGIKFSYSTSSSSAPRVIIAENETVSGTEVPYIDGGLQNYTRTIAFTVPEVPTGKYVYILT